MPRGPVFEKSAHQERIPAAQRVEGGRELAGLLDAQLGGEQPEHVVGRERRQLESVVERLAHQLGEHWTRRARARAHIADDHYPGRLEPADEIQQALQ
jgi:hypothetical protein